MGQQESGLSLGKKVVLQNRQCGHETKLLRYVTDSQVDRAGPIVSATDHHTTNRQLASVRAQQPGENLRQSGFACPVLSDDRVYATRAELNRHTVQGLERAKPLRDVDSCDRIH